MKNRRVHFAFDERSLEDIEKLKAQGRAYRAWVPEPGESQEMPRMFTELPPPDIEHWEVKEIGSMGTFTLQDGTILQEDDILKFDPATKKWCVEKDSLIGQLIEEMCPIAWTSTLPTKNDRYWCRLGKTKPFLVDLEIVNGQPIVWDIDKEQSIPSIYIPNHEWWPIPLTPPED